MCCCMFWPLINKQYITPFNVMDYAHVKFDPPSTHAVIGSHAPVLF